MWRLKRMSKNIKIYQDLMGENEKWASKTRQILSEHNIYMINIIGSPGAGKTTLLENINASFLDKGLNIAVLEGDVETTNDAKRLDALNIEVSQLLTKGACHLEAKLVHKAILDLNLNKLDLIIVENVGNLVCPAEFDIGEHAKIALLSVTEGEDKPIKYPLLFTEAKCVILSKIDLLEYLPFKLDKCLDYIKQVNSNIPIFQTSAFKNIGLDKVNDWLINQIQEMRQMKQVSDGK